METMKTRPRMRSRSRRTAGRNGSREVERRTWYSAKRAAIRARYVAIVTRSM